jgi:hypothetical protein
MDMTRMQLMVCVLAMCGLMLGGCRGGQPRVESGVNGTRGVSLFAQNSGDSSTLTTAGAWLITSAAELDATGSEELRGLNVDFDTHSLVVVALGEKPTGGYWARITGVQVKGDALFVQAVANRPGPKDAVTQAITYPYAAAVVEKVSAATVHPEVQSVEGRPRP